MQGEDPVDGLLASFGRWAAGERSVAAAGQRSRERWLRQQAASAATWAGVLVDLAEQSAPVVVTVERRRRAGRLVGVGQDFLVLDQTVGRPALICLDAVSCLEPASRGSSAGSRAAGRGGAPPPGGDRQATIGLDLASALAALAEDRAPVSVVVPGGEVTGDLVAVGEDLLVLRCAGGQAAYVHRGAVALCELR
ncbi:MAG: hypothetical protein ACRDWW_10535 [Acidimicrobiales bacterium]